MLTPKKKGKLVDSGTATDTTVVDVEEGERHGCRKLDVVSEQISLAWCVAALFPWLQLLSLGRAGDRGGKPRNCKDEEEGCLPEIKDESGRVEVNGRCSVRVCWVGWVPISIAA
ncbi:uncharacterized protein DS421_4g109780 [Arachis hypogaea]|nr:uncharacterized protein DS421_4g109780 [Arachis hypogaea]